MRSTALCQCSNDDVIYALIRSFTPAQTKKHDQRLPLPTTVCVRYVAEAAERPPETPGKLNIYFIILSLQRVVQGVAL